MKQKITDQQIKQEALKYKTRGEFQKNSPNMRMCAIRRGIYEKVCSHMEPSQTGAWTNEELQAVALKYKTRGEFVKFSPNEYNASIRKDILNNICAHMQYSRQYWTTDLILIEALKYKTRGEFKNKNYSAYSAARERKIIDIVCSHMRKNNIVSCLEKELFDFVKELYPNAIKIRDRQVKIQDKPYIKGFDVDIFIPELNKGIEFDGHYYHSFEFMRKDKKKQEWSDEDIHNYHKIKDNYFASKGIKLLHITDLEWINNKEQSLSKILDFLRN